MILACSSDDSADSTISEVPRPSAPEASSSTQSQPTVTPTSGEDLDHGSPPTNAPPGQWSSVRCFDANGSPLCYASDGDYSALVFPECWLYTLTEPEVFSPEPALHQCGNGPDSSDQWVEIICFGKTSSVRCNGRRGDWWSEIVADCGDLVVGEPYPLEFADSCNDATTVGGFDETLCAQSEPDWIECYGRMGQYWLKDPVVPNCYVDDLKRSYPEIDPATVGCH